MVKLGYMDEADRLDRHWANLTTFTQASGFLLMLYIPLLISLPSPDRMYVGLSMSEGTFAFQYQPTQAKYGLISILTSTKCPGFIYQRALLHNQTT